MALRPTRPSWLFEEHRLEALIEQNDLKISLSALRASRNECRLVDEVLKRILSEQNILTMPGEFEMYWAKTHLAMDIQSILKRWCSVGWDKTWEGSALRSLCPEVPKQPGDRNMDDATSTTTTTTAITPADTAVEQQKIRLPKPEPTRPRFSEPFPAGRQNSHSGWTPCNGSVAQSVGAESATTAIALANSRVYPVPVQPATKRQFEDSDDYLVRRVSKSKSVNFGDRTQFICPYHAQNTNGHPECANKSFPNPRKLKEHVWRWLKPFKCPTCGEGFGREKTRAIHCDQRKTKCKSMPSTYEGSAEQRRDQKIESAKSTREMIEIFEEYEREKHTPRDDDSSSPSTNSHNQDKNGNSGGDSASDEHHHHQVGEYRDNPDDRSSSPESRNTSNVSLSGGDSDHGDNYTTARSNHTYTQPQQTSGARIGEGVGMDIDSGRDSTNNKEQEREEEEAVGLGLNPRHKLDHLNTNNTQHSLSQDSFQYPLRQLSRDENESRTLYLLSQISPILSPSSDMNYSASNSPNTIMNPGTLSTNLLSNVPEIVITDAEPQIKSPAIVHSSDADPYAQQTVYYPNPTSCSPPPNGLYNHESFRGGGDEEQISLGTDDVPYGLNSRAMGQGYVAAPLVSNGYGSFPRVRFRMNFG